MTNNFVNSTQTRPMKPKKKSSRMQWNNCIHLEYFDTMTMSKRGTNMHIL